jgi:hypothetical protein
MLEVLNWIHKKYGNQKSIKMYQVCHERLIFEVDVAVSWCYSQMLFARRLLLPSYFDVMTLTVMAMIRLSNMHIHQDVRANTTIHPRHLQQCVTRDLLIVDLEIHNTFCIFPTNLE